MLGLNVDFIILFNRKSFSSGLGFSIVFLLPLIIESMML